MRDHTPRADPLLVARNIVQNFPLLRQGAPQGIVHAVSGVSIELGIGETLGIVGESGSGKTTLVRALAQAPKPTSGTVHFHGVDLTKQSGSALLAHRRQMQMVFQDPFASLNPCWSVTAIVEEPLVGYGVGTRSQRAHRVAEVLELVGLPSSIYGRRSPRELSGGQCQRVAIARALALRPSLLICDEAVSALDVLTQSQLLNLLEQLQRELHLSHVFVSHDLAVVKQISDRLAVLHRGRLCEVGPTSSIFRHPLHPYTAALLDAQSTAPPSALMPDAGPPSDEGFPVGCSYFRRCPVAQQRCGHEVPVLRTSGEDHRVACHFPNSLPAAQAARGFATPAAGPPASAIAGSHSS